MLENENQREQITMPNQIHFVRQTAAVLMACGLIASLLPGFAAAQGGANKPPLTGRTEAAPYVIFEDDFDSDSDGPMALCQLLELEAAGECKIIACGASELHEDSTATMAATLHYFGRGDIPLGSYRDDLHPRDPEMTQLYDDSYFNANMASDTFNYGHPRRHRRDYPDAVEVYVQALTALPPGAKAKLIIGGAHNNLRDLLEAHPDLVRSRVSELHFMGGWCWPDNGKPAETDWNRDSNLWSTRFDTQFIAENWPPEIPVFIADTAVGNGVLAGQLKTREKLSDLHPAKRIQTRFRIDWDKGHNALDQMSVLSAVRGFKNFNGVDISLRRGRLEVNDQPDSEDYGRHRFIGSPDGPHYLMRRPQDAASAQKLADYLDAILLLRGGDAGDGVFRDEFTATRGKQSTETLQTRRGWIKAGHPGSDTLIDGSDREWNSEKAQFVQFIGNSRSAPYNVQLKDLGAGDLRLRARVMVTHQDGFIGLCLRADVETAPMGIHLRVQPNGPGLRLYDGTTALPQTRSHGQPTAFTTRTWFTIELQIQGERVIGRLYDDSDNARLLEQVEGRLPHHTQGRRHAGLIARGNGERADWFQSGQRPPAFKSASAKNGP
jgi:hypothetical protein